MFAYCRSNPVCRIDVSGFKDQNAADLNEEVLEDGEILGLQEGGGDGGFWNGFLQSLDNATRGLAMASGQRTFAGAERHHVASNKNSKYTPQYKEVTDRYNMELDRQENIVVLQGHKGRHTNAYHDFILNGIHELNRIAMGDETLFHEGYRVLVNYVIDHPQLPYAKYK